MNQWIKSRWRLNNESNDNVMTWLSIIKYVCTETLNTNTCVVIIIIIIINCIMYMNCINEAMWWIIIIIIMWYELLYQLIIS